MAFWRLWRPGTVTSSVPRRSGAPSRRRCTTQRPPKAPTSTSVPVKLANGLVTPYVTSLRSESRQHWHEMRVVGARDDGAVEGNLVRKLRERLLKFLEAPVGLHVLAIDVRNHRDRWPQHRKRPIALVGLRDHVLAAESRVAAKRTQPATNDGIRVQTAAVEHERNH